MLGWQTMSDEESIAAAIDEHGEENARPSVAYCGLATKFNGILRSPRFGSEFHKTAEERAG